MSPGSFWPVVNEMSFKDISIYSSDGHFVQWSKTVCAIMVEGIMRNISMESFLIWNIVSKEVVLRYFYF